MIFLFLTTLKETVTKSWDFWTTGFPEGRYEQSFKRRVGKLLHKLSASLVCLLAVTLLSLLFVVQTVSAQGTNVCSRTAAVRDAIVAATEGISNCADITADHLAAISTLGLSSQSITGLQAGDFSNLSGLTELNLSGNGLATLPANIFSNLSGLTRLSLSSNRFGTLPADIFSNLSGLTRLSLSSNRFGTLPADIFSNLSGLTELNLSENELATLPADIFSNLSGLTRLSLSSNRFGTLPAGLFSELTVLRELNLVGSQLTELPAGIFSNLSALILLRLGLNLFATLPADVFSNLSALRELYLGYNVLLTELPAGLFSGLTSLTLLDLSVSGGLAVLPYGIFSDVPMEAIQLDDGVTIALNTAAALTAFSLPGQIGEATINPSDSTVVLEVASDTDVTALVATFSFSAGARVTVRGVSQVSRLTANDFIHPVSYTVAAQDGITTQEWTVTVIIASTTAFSTFSLPDQIGEATINSFFRTVALEVAYGTDLIAPLVATFTLSSGATAAVGGVLQVSTTTANTFTDPVRYTVTAEDGEASQIWVVTVTIASANTAMTDSTTFSLPGQIGDAIVNLSDRTIAIVVGYDTDVRSLIAVFALSSGATAAVGGVLQVSAITANDFTHPVTYVVTAEDGTTMQIWVVTVTVRAQADVCNLTAAVRDAIVAVTEGISNCANITADHLAKITYLDLRHMLITSLQAGDFSGLTNLDTLDLGGNQLTVLPSGLFSNPSALRELYLGANRLSVLPSSVFSGLTNLQTLDLSSNGLSELSSDTFSGLDELIGLNLLGNELSELSPGVFSGLTNLQFLGLSSNELSELSPGTFSGLNALIGLDLGYNRLLTLSSGVFSGLTNLQFLDLSSNPLLSVLSPGVFLGLTNLQTLDLFGNELVTLSSGTFLGLDALIGLDLSNNELSDLSSGTFSGLSRLAELTLGGNQLITLPMGVFSGLNALIGLDLSNNELSDLSSGTFSGLNALIGLDLSNNELSDLSSGTFSGLSGLAELNLGGNQLITLPMGVFSGLSGLAELNLSGNGLTVLPMGVFSNLSGLTDLYLFANELTTLPPGVFSNLSGLTRLYLSFNEELTTLPPGVFSGLTNLQFLFLSFNGLTELSKDVFSELDALIGLDLSFNELTALPKDVFSGLDALLGLSLSDNGLAELPKGVFSNFSGLRDLDLTNNALALVLPYGIFSDVSMDAIRLDDGVRVALPKVATALSAFSLPGQMGEATINPSSRTVVIAVEYGTDVSTLVATFSLSVGATAAVGGVSQVSATTTNDFTHPVNYTVTAEDGEAARIWTVTVTVAAILATANADDLGDYLGRPYPNPSKGTFIVPFRLPATYSRAVIIISDLSGRAVLTKTTGRLTEGTYEVEINLLAVPGKVVVPGGMYIVELNLKGKGDPLTFHSILLYSK